MSFNARIHRRATIAIVIGAAVLISSTALAATNQGTGDIAGDAAALTASNVFSLNSAQLALVKRAFLPDGTALASGANVPTGTLVKFLIYIDNTTTVPVSDLSAQDILAATFAYQAGTLKIDNSVATGATEAAIYAAVNAQTAGSDVVDGDAVSLSGSTINVGNQSQANAQLDIAASKVFAVLFTVKMQ